MDGLLAKTQPAFRRLTGRGGRQFVKFSIVGAANAVLDFAVYIGLTRFTGYWHAHYVGAASVSFVLAVLSSYVINTYWTFRQQGTDHVRAAKFFAVAAAGLCWNALIIWSLLGLGLYDIFAKIIATGAVLAWNFTLQKYWTFREPKTSPEVV